MYFNSFLDIKLNDKFNAYLLLLKLNMQINIHKKEKKFLKQLHDNTFFNKNML